MIDAIFVHPGAQQTLFGPLANFTAIEPPTTLRMTAGYVRDRGPYVALADMVADDLSPAQLAELTEHLDPRLVVIVASGHQPSASTQAMVGVRAAALAIKQINAHRPILVMGNHPSALPERTLREEPIDFVAVGEGPATIMALLGNSLPPPFGNVPGLAYRVTDTILVNPQAPLIEDLDQDLHGDLWYALPMHRYKAHTWHALTGRAQPYASIYTTLNCPFACHFCCISAMFGGSNRYRKFSSDFVVDQVARLYHSYGVRSLKIADELFLLNRSHVREVCEGLVATGISHDLNIWCYGRTDSIDPDDLPLLRRAGIRWIALGIEAGSPDVRAGTNKRLKGQDDNAEIVDLVRTIQGADINVVGNFIFGLPGDTVETMQQTLDLALAILPEHANFYGSCAYPGSKLYEDAVKNNWPMPADWSGWSQHSATFLPTPTATLTGPEVRAFRDEAWRRYFTDPRYLASIEQKFGEEARVQVAAVAAVRLR